MIMYLRYTSTMSYDTPKKNLGIFNLAFLPTERK